MLLGLYSHHCDVALARDLQECIVGETRMPHLDRVAQFQLSKLRRQHIEIGIDLVGIELLIRRHLPEDRPELRAQLANATVEEPFDRLRRFAQIFALHRRARRLHRELKAVWCCRRPFFEGCGRLCAIKRGVDLDCRDFAGRVFELLRRRQFRRIERLLPGLIAPAANSDPDHNSHLAT